MGKNLTPPIRVHNPIGVALMLSFLGARGGSLVLPPPLLAAYLVQATGNGSYAYSIGADTAPVACAGVWHDDEGSRAWFLARPEAARHMTRLLCAGRSALATEAARAAGGRIEAQVVPGHRPGERMAALLGFVPGDIDAGYRSWIRTDGRSTSHTYGGW